MSNLDVETRAVLIGAVQQTISNMVKSYLEIDECDLDMKELEVLKKTFDALVADRPFDNESRVYLKTMAADKIYETIESLRELVVDIPTLAKEVGALLAWYHIAKDV